MGRRTIITTVGLVSLLLFAACNGSKPWVSQNSADWQTKSFAQEQVAYKVFLIGDCGKPSIDSAEPSFVLLQSKLTKAGENSAVIFLGDNIYNAGLLPEGHEDRTESLRRINTQLDILRDYKGTVVYVPGNHDWDNNGENGWEAVNREEKHIEDSLNRGNTFRPDNGCSGPSVVSLPNDIAILAYDSQWWLHNHDKPTRKDGCEADNEDEFVTAMDTAIKQNADKNIIVVAHHPFYSNGPHGRRFPLYEHFFPLTAFKKNLWVPLPIFGSIYVFARKLGASNQDIGNKKYKALKKALVPVFSQHKDLVYAAGHEHDLQYFNKDEQHYIVSGSGTKKSYTVGGHGAEFTYGAKGFSVLNYLENGEVWVEFICPERGGMEEKVVFRKQLK